jgi:hypothetical protein
MNFPAIPNIFYMYQLSKRAHSLGKKALRNKMGVKKPKPATMHCIIDK